MRNARGVGSVVCFGDNLSVSHDQQAVETERCPEVNQLSELLRTHALLFRGGRLPFLRWPNWFCCALGLSSPAANRSSEHECAQRSRQKGPITEREGMNRFTGHGDNRVVGRSSFLQSPNEISRNGAQRRAAGERHGQIEFLTQHFQDIPDAGFGTRSQPP